MKKITLYKAKHYWENNENAKWQKHPKFDEKILSWLKENYIFLENKRPNFKVFNDINKTILLFYNDKKDIYNRKIVEIECFQIDYMFSEEEIKKMLLKLKNSFNTDNNFEIIIDFSSNSDLLFKNIFFNYKLVSCFLILLSILLSLVIIFFYKNYNRQNISNKKIIKLKSTIRSNKEIKFKICKKIKKDDIRIFMRYLYLLCNDKNFNTSYEKWEENLLKKKLNEDYDFIQWKNSLPKDLKEELKKLLKKNDKLI